MSSVKIPQLIDTGLARFDALVLRERILVGVTLLALVWLVWTVAVQDHLQNQRNQVSAGINAASAQLNAAVREQRLLSNGDLKDPDALLRTEQQLLQAELAQLEQELRDSIERFVEPKRMPELLAELMKQHRGLQFKRVTRLPTEALAASVNNKLLVQQASGAAATGQNNKSVAPSVYRHPIELEFEGSYFNVLAYLLTLEHSGWRLNWRSLNYLVKDYPVARVTIQVDTLSRRKEWLGV